MDDRPTKVLCMRPGCDGVVAHIYGEKMVSIKRSKNVIQTIGREYNMVITCPYKNCFTKTSIICEGGKIKKDYLRLLDESKISDDKDGKKEENSKPEGTKPEGGESENS